MDWFEYIRQNIWAGILVASILTSLAVSFLNLTKKAQEIDNTKLNIIFAIVIGVAVTKFDLDWSLFSSYQDTVIRLGATVLLSYLVAKVKGQEVTDAFIAKVVDGAKNFNIGKKDGQ
jgi:hypothetical protein